VTGFYPGPVDDGHATWFATYADARRAYPSGSWRTDTDEWWGFTDDDADGLEADVTDGDSWVQVRDVPRPPFEDRYTFEANLLWDRP